MKTKVSVLFDELNRRYWRGRLPKYRVIRRNLSGKLLGRCDNERRTILLDNNQIDEDLRLTLLHEMCHIGRTPGWEHGPTFRRKVNRLVRLGESKLIEDVERYDGTAVVRYLATLKHPIPEISFRQAVMDDIESLAMTYYRRQWPRVLTFLAHQYRMTPARFRRLAPWAERTWRKSAAEYRREETLRRKFFKKNG